jgi:short-chain fatty acids transporter
MSSNSKTDRSHLSKFIESFSKWSIRWIPDSMVFVLALSLICFFLSWGLTPHGPIQLVDDWIKGFWALLTFAMQMCLLMITGFTVADSKYVKSGIRKLVDWPKTKTGTILSFAFFTGVLWYIHWGIGMMTGIIMGREIAVRKKGMGIHYPLLAAISYSGIVLCNGPSQAAQLLVATPGHVFEKLCGVIPLTQTTFDIRLLVTQAVLLLSIPLVYLVMMPRANHSIEIDDATAASFITEEPKDDPDRKLAPAERWDRSALLPFIIGAAGLIWALNFLYTKGVGRLDLNTLNFIFLMLGLLLQRNPRNFISSVQRGTSAAYGIIIQFPLYAGIFGMISYSGLAEVIATWFVNVSTAHTFPWIVFVYSGIVDMFVPSAGSKFVIEAPYIIPAAKQLGANLPYTIDAYTFGSICFNLIQPFWALPTLGAFKLRFQDILPYSFLICCWSFIVISFGLLVLPLLF